jgi:pSer/pThr/pTyr-binding forkhead associated (FHA) protein/S1-C subfamily serine protease
MSRIARRAPFAHLTGLVAATAAVVAVIASPARAAAPPDASLEKVSNLVTPSIVQLHTQYAGLVRDERGHDVNGGKPVKIETTCSGFIVNANGYIATAGRCVDLDVATDRLIDVAASDAFKNHPEQVPDADSLRELKTEAKRDWSVVSPSRRHRERPDRKVTAISDVIAGQAPDSRALPASVRRVRGPQNGDVALVKAQAQDLPALQLAPASTVKAGAPAVSFGFPGSADRVAGVAFTPSFQEGSVGEEKTVDGGLNRAFEVGTAFSAAMSGGPTVDLDGRVLGVNRSRPRRPAPASNLISPGAEVQQLLQDVGAPNDLGSTSRAYRSGLDALSRGDRGTALALFDQTLKLQPGFKLAELFRSRAQRLPVPSDGGLAEWLKLLIGSGVVTSFLGLVGGGTRRRRRRRRDNAVSVAADRAPDAGDETPALVVQDGKLAGHRVAVHAELVIGRQDVDLVLDDSHVSRHHAVVRPIDGGLEIEDLGSANGTSVNGVAIDGSQRLHDGDVVQVGRVRLTADVARSHREVTVLAGGTSGAHVVVTRGPLAGRCYAVGTELVIGRQDADLLLDHPQVSRRHAVVRAIDGELEVEDLGSANGTFVNGGRVDEPQRLCPGDEIAIGPIVLEARRGDERDLGAATVVTAA